MAKRGRKPADLASFTARFWDSVKRGAPDECWEWQRSRCGLHGEYGNTYYNGKRLTAHRAAWMLTCGSLPDDKLEVCHTCDNPLCCNPAHLWIGTHKQNMDDKANKKRGNVPYGNAHKNAKLDDDKIALIRSCLASGVSQRAIAREFGVSQPTICYINHDIRWKQSRQESVA